REARLRAEIEEKKREIRLLNEEIDFQRIEKMSVELELKRVKELIDRGDIACAVAERGNVGVSAASETLMVREATLKSAIEEKVGEIEQNDQFKNWGKLNFEIDVQIIRGEKRGEELKKVGENSKVEKGVVGQEKRKFGVHDGNACPFGEHGKKDGPNASGNGFDLVEESLDVKEATMTATIEDKMKEIRLLHEKLVKKEKCATAKVKDEKVDVMAEKKSLADEPSKNAGLGGSSGNWWTNSSRVVSKNFTTKLAEPAGVLKRDFASSAGYVSNVLDGLDTDSSSSSSSSSSGEFDISSFTSLKRTKLS
ncbi:hypothetical protein KIW84_054776, partial [Lathyrus oleraceus]